MPFFPFFKDITNMKVLIVGGGNVAFRKAEKLDAYDPEITVVAPVCTYGFRNLEVKIIDRKFRDSDITRDLGFVIAATDDETLNRRIAMLCSDRDIPVNVVDEPELCTFLFPALVNRGDLSVGISTSGASPAASAWLRKEVEKILPPDMEDILMKMKKERSLLKEQTEDQKIRSICLKRDFTKYINRESRQKNDEENQCKCSVNLVGAGCGGREWLTLEGLQLLRSCDAVVYDDLIDEDLLTEVPCHAERIYVGKRGGRPSAVQKDIEQLLVDLARQNKNVVRLKGGDPFVFGRGGEEIQTLNKNHIPWKVVPGITSALAIPAEAGIPATHRGISRSIHIITARTKDSVFRDDMEKFAELEGTLIFLMGIECLDDIVTALVENGRDISTPAAVLSGGNSPYPYKVTGTLGDIAQRAEEANVTSPGIIVVGDAVALDLNSESLLPLSGVTVGLTGTDDFQAKLRRRLMLLGADTVSMMRGHCSDTKHNIPWNAITDKNNKWLVFTSVQGVRSFFRRCRNADTDNRGFAFCRFAVIGKATESELKKYGFTADICPHEYTSAALADELSKKAEKHERIYLFCSVKGTDLLTAALTENGFSCIRINLYDTHFSKSQDISTVPQYVMFGSAGGVEATCGFGYHPQDPVTGICIGPVCADAYRKHFEKEPIIAEAATSEAMIKALMDHITGKEVWKK